MLFKEILNNFSNPGTSELNDKYFFENKHRFILKIVFVIVCAVLCIVNFYPNMVTSGDTITYDRLATQLIQTGFDYAVIVREVSSQFIFYLVPMSIFAFAKMFFHNNWKTFVLIINLMSICAAVAMYVKIADTCRVNCISTCLLLISFVLFPDFLYWPHYILTDTMYLFLVSCCVLFALQLCVYKFKVRIFLYFFVLTCLLTFFRPASPPVVVCLIVFILIFNNKSILLKKNPVFFISALCVGIVLVFSYIVDKNIHGYYQWPELNMMSKFISEGVVIHDRPETFVKFNNGFFSVLYVFICRFVYFFSPSAESFSTLHKVINLLSFLIAGILILVGETMMFMREIVIDCQKYIGRSLMLGLIICVATYHSITLIDFDWRYRYPIIPVIFCLAMFHFEIINSYIKAKKNININRI